MAYFRLVQSSAFMSRLAQLSVSPSIRSTIGGCRLAGASHHRTVVRLFGRKGSFVDIGDKVPRVDHMDDEVPLKADLEDLSTIDDPFGVDFDDGKDGLGPQKNLPPIYKRDSATGRLTGEIEHELSEEEKRVLKADPLEQDDLLLKRFDMHWQKSGLDDSGQPAELDKLGERVRVADMGLNVLGRSVKAQASKDKLDDGSELGRDETGFSHQLTKGEFEAFAKYMDKEHKIKVDEEDIPVEERPRRTKYMEEDPDNVELSLKWLTSRAQRQMDERLDDNPYSDLMPGDLSPSRLVNRKRAKPIPTAVLHHNNIALLERYLTPTGQIMNRVQSRLGARDQRRVAKLIKRARSLGLLPYFGQFKCEQHGWIHAADINEEKEWEKELVRRGLVIKRDNTETRDDEY
jgi:ribosomal protein S18